jgi:hypothetical protein
LQFGLALRGQSTKDAPCVPVGTGVTAWLSFEESFFCLPL